jgi:hypothetical protein
LKGVPTATRTPHKLAHFSLLLRHVREETSATPPAFWLSVGKPKQLESSVKAGEASSSEGQSGSEPAAGAAVSNTTLPVAADRSQEHLGELARGPMGVGEGRCKVVGAAIRAGARALCCLPLYAPHFPNGGPHTRRCKGDRSGVAGGGHNHVHINAHLAGRGM